MKAKVAVSIDEGLLGRLDELVGAAGYESRSAAVEAAVRKLFDALAAERFDRELDKLDVAEEQALAEEGMDEYAALARDSAW